MVPKNLIHVLINLISVYFVLGFVTNINELNNKSGDPTERTALEENAGQQLNSVEGSFNNSCANCKKYASIQGKDLVYKIYPIDDRTLCHAIVKKDHDDLKYFEMNIAIKTAHDAYILLSPVATPSTREMDRVFIIGVGVSSDHTMLYQYLNLTVVKDVNTPNILSAADYVYFNIKISDDTLTFTKEGDDAPLLTYDDSGLRKMKYYSFSYWTKTKFLYDCPISKH